MESTIQTIHKSKQITKITEGIGIIMKTNSEYWTYDNYETATLLVDIFLTRKLRLY